MTKEQASQELSGALLHLADTNKKLGEAQANVHTAWVRVNELLDILEVRL